MVSSRDWRNSLTNSGSFQVLEIQGQVSSKYQIYVVCAQSFERYCIM